MEQQRLAAEREATLAARRLETTAARRQNRPKEIAELRDLLLQNTNDLVSHREANAQSDEWNTYLACRTVPHGQRSGLGRQGGSAIICLSARAHRRWCVVAVVNLHPEAESRLRYRKLSIMAHVMMQPMRTEC